MPNPQAYPFKCRKMCTVLAKVKYYFILFEVHLDQNMDAHDVLQMSCSSGETQSLQYILMSYIPLNTEKLVCPVGP